MHHGQFRNAVTGDTVHESLKSDPIPKFIYKKMERYWAREFVKGSVQIGSLAYYRTVKDASGMIVDPHEGLEVTEVTADLATGPMLQMSTNGSPPAIGSLLLNKDDRRLVFCASESTRVPPRSLGATYDTWVRIEAEPAMELIDRELRNRVSDVDGPVFKKVVYDPTIDGPDDTPPIRPFFRLVENGMHLNDRWHTKRPKFEPQREVRVGWLASPALSAEPIVLSVNGLRDYVDVLPSKAARKAARRAART